MSPIASYSRLAPLPRHLPSVALLALLLASAAAAKTVAPPANLRAADALAAQPAGTDRDRALQKWADRATLPELVYVLRRSARELAGAESPLLLQALERAPIQRTALRRRLYARLLRIDPERARRVRDAPAETPLLYPHASVFSAAVLLPDSGSYEDYGRSVREGARAALGRTLTPAGTPLELRMIATGDDRPDRALAAFDSVAGRSGALIGELLSVPTLLLATAARFAGIPLISPTATDENVGAVSPAVFQVGPSGWQRGAVLARAALGGEKPRIGVLTSSAHEGGSFARGFEATAKSLGAEVAWRGEYASGALNFRDAVRNLSARQVELLFWDGDAREAEALVRQLTRDRISVRICGSDALAPERHHTETRVLLEGVQYVPEDWTLPDSLAARLGGDGKKESAGLAARGYLAGAVLAAALRSGALCPEEITAWLSTRVAREPYLRTRGFLDLAPEGARLPVYTVRRGRAVAMLP